jgi:hypothetical protein
LKTHVLLATAALTLGACDNPKPRHVPDDPMALAPPPAAVAAPTEGLSAGLPKRPEFPGFYLDRVGSAPDPLNRRPAVTSAAQPIVMDGFGFDPVTRTPAKGVDVVVDGKAYGAAYGHKRQDVADFHKTPALADVGYTVTLPVGTLAPGAHSAVVRVIASDGKAYFESPPIGFQVSRRAAPARVAH